MGQARQHRAHSGGRCPHDVEDLVQEVFASLLLRSGRLQMVYVPLAPAGASWASNSIAASAIRSPPPGATRELTVS